MTVWKLLGRSHKIAMHSFRKVTSTMKRQKTRNPVESHDKFPTINPAISTFLPAIPARWLFAIVQLKKFASAVREPEKKIPSKQFLLIYFPVAKDVLPWSGKKVCFGLRLIRLARSLYRMGESWGTEKKNCENLWSHFGIITIYCSWMIFKFFIWTNKHKNMFSYFSLPWKWFFLRIKLERFLPVSPSWMKWTFHCCPLVGGRMRFLLSSFGSDDDALARGFVFHTTFPS